MAGEEWCGFEINQAGNRAISSENCYLLKLNLSAPKFENFILRSSEQFTLIRTVLKIEIDNNVYLNGSPALTIDSTLKRKLEKLPVNGLIK